MHKKILLLSEGFGTGHTQAAKALSASLKQHAPHVSTHVMELGAHQHPLIAPLIFNIYRHTLTFQPKLIGMLYNSKYENSIRPVTQLALHRIFYAQSARIIQHYTPDVIVCTHPFPNMIVSRLKRSGLNTPLCTVITDYDAHAAWISPQTDAYLVSTPEVKSNLLLRGVEDRLINVTGIPVHPKFRIPHHKDTIRKKFNLQSVPTILVMGGGWGIMKHANFLTHMLEWKERIQFIFCLGSNDKERQKMLADPLFNHPNIRLLGFTDNIDELMDVSDLLITKPGGITCSEGLAKGLPMLLHNPFPGQEERNCDCFIARGFADRLHSSEQLLDWFNRLTMSCPTIAQRRANLHQAQLYSPSVSLQPILHFIK